MTLPRTLLLIALVTCSILLYAHEQVSKVILLYDIQHHQKERGLLSDAHHLLKCQVSALSSPSSLETLLAKRNVQLEQPEGHQVIRLAMEEKRVGVSKKKNLFDWISTTKIAEAGSR